MADIISYQMASTIYRLASLVVIFTIVLVSLVRPELRTIINWEKEDELKVICLAEDPTTWITKGKEIRMFRHNEAKPMVVVYKNRGTKKSKNFPKNILVDGKLFRNRQIYINLTIREPRVQDAGDYRCELVFVNKAKHFAHEVVRFKVKVERKDLKMLGRLAHSILFVKKTIGGLDSMQSKTRQRLQRHKENMEIAKDFIQLYHERQACVDKRWTYYQYDQTCIKVYGKNGYGLQPWENARSFCQKYGADLVQIHDDEKKKFVFDLFHSSRLHDPWIGVINNSSQGADYRYVNGSKVVYMPLSEYHYNPLENKCAVMHVEQHARGVWYFDQCVQPRSFVCSLSISHLLPY